MAEQEVENKKKREKGKDFNGIMTWLSSLFFFSFLRLARAWRSKPKRCARPLCHDARNLLSILRNAQEGIEGK